MDVAAVGAPRIDSVLPRRPVRQPKGARVMDGGMLAAIGQRAVTHLSLP
jgi:hypothetical protein